MTAPIDCLGVLAIRGTDAIPFSHSQLANDVKALPNGHWQWNTLLQIQGRVLALALLARVADDEILLVVPRDVRTDVRSTLARYVLRSKVRIEEDEGLRVEGSLATPEPGSADAVACGGALDIGDGTLGIMLGGRHARQLVIARADRATDASVDDAWSAADIDDGIPWVRAGTAGEFIPQALGLDRLAAYSVSKGCYPGQEIVARTHFLGRNKRALRRFSGPAGKHLHAPGDRLHGTAGGAGDPLAVVIDAMRIDGRIDGLAVSRDSESGVAYWLGDGPAVPVDLRAP
jgi:folate-binding protein YgfZ